MKADLRISVKDLDRGKNLKILLSRTPFTTRQYFVTMNGAAWPGHKNGFSLSLHRMRGEGWGEGSRASAVVATPLIRPAATFSPPPRKGEGIAGRALTSVRKALVRAAVQVRDCLRATAVASKLACIAAEAA